MKQVNDLRTELIPIDVRPRPPRLAGRSTVQSNIPDIPVWPAWNLAPSSIEIWTLPRTRESTSAVQLPGIIVVIGIFTLFPASISVWVVIPSEME